MIDYDKLKKAHELAIKAKNTWISTMLRRVSEDGFGLSYTLIQGNDITQATHQSFCNIDKLIEKLELLCREDDVEHD